jgi:hypothetical protein
MLSLGNPEAGFSASAGPSPGKATCGVRRQADWASMCYRTGVQPDQGSSLLFKSVGHESGSASWAAIDAGRSLQWIRGLIKRSLKRIDVVWQDVRSPACRRLVVQVPREQLWQRPHYVLASFCLVAIQHHRKQPGDGVGAILKICLAEVVGPVVLDLVVQSPPIGVRVSGPLLPRLELQFVLGMSTLSL